MNYPLRRSPLGRQFAATIAIFAVVQAIILAMAILGLQAMDTTRAFIASAGNYASEHGRAVAALHSYAASGDPLELEIFSDAIALPLGIREARHALEMTPPDRQRAARHLRATRTHPDDVPGMIRLFLWFGSYGPFEQAVAAWRRADTRLLELISVSEALEARLGSGAAMADSGAVDALVSRLRRLDAAFNRDHRAFTELMGAVARQGHRTILWSLLVGSALLWAVGLFLATRLVRRSLRSERSLQESRQRFQDYAESASDWLWETDADLRFTYFSRPFQATTGLQAEDLIGRRREEVALDRDDPKWQEHAERLAKRLPFRGFRYLLTDRQGRWRITETSGKPVFDAEGRFRGYRGTSVDITERVEAEERFRRIFEDAHIGIAVLSPQGRLLTFNPHFQQMLGYSPDALAAMTIVDLAPEADKPRARNCLEAFAAGDCPEDSVERRYLDAAGRIVEVQVSVAVVRDARGMPGSLICVVEDITERKQAERALAAREAELRTIIDNTRDGIVLLDDAGQVVRANIAADRLLTGDGESLVGRRMRDLFSPDEAGRLDQAVNEASDVPGNQQVFLEIEETATATPHPPLELALSAVHDCLGARRGIVVALRDLSERRRTQTELQRSQRLRAIGQLAGGIAHDFNNLLGVILANLEMAEAAVADRPDPVRKLQLAARAARQGADLTERLVAFARRQDLVPRATDVAALVHDMEDLLRHSLGSAIALEIAADESLPHAMIDPAQLESALLNLVINARDAVGVSGTVRITIGESAADAGRTAEDGSRGPFLALCVEDDGIGMTPEVLDRVLEPFFTTKDVDRGTGLGLPMAYGFARQSGGDLLIDSEPGVGTRVCLLLPAVAPPEAEPGTTHKTTPGSGAPWAAAKRRGTILVLEDSTDLRETVTLTLGAMGYETLGAATGEEARQLLAGPARIDAALCDVVLSGGLDGFAAMADVEKLRPDMPVVYMSGYAEEAIARRGGLPRNARLLRKPFGIEKLARLLDEVLGSDG